MAIDVNPSPSNSLLLLLPDKKIHVVAPESLVFSLDFEIATMKYPFSGSIGNHFALYLFLLQSNYLMSQINT